MTDVHAEPYGRTSWKRFAALFGASAACAAALVMGISDGVLASTFVVSGQQFKVSADRLEGTGFVNYGWIDQHADRTAEPVAVSGIRQATLTNMCQSVVTTPADRRRHHAASSPRAPGTARCRPPTW